jgi:hypothetical protein
MSAIRILSRKDVRQWLEGVRFTPTCPSTNSMGRAIWHELHDRAAAFYAHRYFDEHRSLPEGTHHVVLSVRGHGHHGDRGDIEHPCSTQLVDSERAFAADITYPPDPPRLEREGSGAAPARPRPGRPTPSSARGT